MNPTHKAFFITQFSDISGSSRIMAYQFLPFLEQAGIQCQAKSVYPDNFFRVQMGLEKKGKIEKQINFIFYLCLGILKRIYFSIKSRNYDVVFVQKDSFPKLIYKLLLYINPRVIYEFEDAFDEVNPFLKRSFLHRLLLNYQRGLYKNMVRNAAHVIAVNEYVAKQARTVNENVTIICEPINTDICKPAEFKKKSNEITLGWIGSHSTTHFFTKILCQH